MNIVLFIHQESSDFQDFFTGISNTYEDVRSVLTKMISQKKYIKDIKSNHNGGH